MSIKDDLIKYFGQYFGDGATGTGINPYQGNQQFGQINAQMPTDLTAKFGQLNPQMPAQGMGNFDQINDLQAAISKPISAETAMTDLIAKKDPAEKAKGDFKKQLIANSVKSMGSAPQMAQPQLKIINAQQAFAQMPDATQPQQIQEFKPEQMAMMLRRRNGGL